MPETIEAQAFTAPKPSESLQPNEVSSLALERAHFALALSEAGLMSREFSDSGVLDKFEVDTESNYDALKHILIGDDSGGGHHLSTVMELGVGGRVFASRISDPEKPNHTLGEYRRLQKVRGDGSYKVLDVTITDDGGNQLRKMGGSRMFPDEWSAQEVVEAILETSKAPGVHDEQRQSYTHHAEVRGVNIKVITQDKTGKILTAYPK